MITRYQSLSFQVSLSFYIIQFLFTNFNIDTLAPSNDSKGGKVILRVESIPPTPSSIISIPCATTPMKRTRIDAMETGSKVDTRGQKDTFLPSFLREDGSLTKFGNTVIEVLQLRGYTAVGCKTVEAEAVTALSSGSLLLHPRQAGALGGGGRPRRATGDYNGIYARLAYELRGPLHLLPPSTHTHAYLYPLTPLFLRLLSIYFASSFLPLPPFARFPFRAV